jgi:hypothetical protein
MPFFIKNVEPLSDQSSSRLEILHGTRKNLLLGVKKKKISPQSPKTEYTFRGQKGENKPSEPTNGIWGPKPIWSCDISIRLGFFSMG